MSHEDGAESRPLGAAPYTPAEGGLEQDTLSQPEHEDLTLDLPNGLMPCVPGQVLGERYEIRSQLGRGGMGEVWRAFDLKLRVEVALKALLPELFKDERRRDLLRREVRAAREVVSPNVCRIFDLVEAGGIELVSMEYVDGGTLLDVLRERGPLDLKEAQDIASQFLAGLEAIHKAGLVHRDIKPENIMITRAGRVVVMDFGLARQEDSGAGTMSGTPAYMAPEQAAGLPVDARADVYAAGVVLAEMVSPEGIKTSDSRKSLWEGVRSEPVKLPDTPWAPVLKKAVAKEANQRYRSAHTLTRALEDVTLFVKGKEDLTPYPGLASFTEDDAEYFFGRETEVEQMWAKLERPHLLGLIGPSGAGKSSFLKAGLIPSAPADWITLHCTPGNTPVLSLSRALGPEMARNAVAVDLLLRFDDPDVVVEAFTLWRQGHGPALVIVDQFEELFTLNAPEVQARFVELLGRLALETDFHVLLSMRDDFFFQCHQFPALAPMLDGLTMLGPPVGLALRRALVQPATKCGYRFEDDTLVEEMLAEVEGERGALPLLAFATARLWERRDRENGLLTRRAYKDIGGVAGAMARHAEATIERTGNDRLSLVRELFRNLITSEGTRAVREWSELLAVFEDQQRAFAEEILRDLIDARLLTSYEIQEEGKEPTRSVEIIHESLLANWPRLVRWQTQDADSAQLRDQLRQAARTWEEHDRSDDMLWTGAAFKEFEVWRERYPGGLTDTEKAFGDAMTVFAGRRRRRRRTAMTAIIAALVIGLALVGSFWQRSVHEARRAEAANLVSLGQLELDSYPSAAVAHAIASLELSDTAAARRLGLEALWKGPTAFVVNEIPSWEIGFTPDGQWLVQSADSPPYPLHIIGADGSDELLEDIHEGWIDLRMGPESRLFATLPTGRDPTEPLALWSVPEKRLLAKGRSGYPDNTFGVYADLKRRRVLLLALEDDRFFVDALGFDGRTERLGALPFDLRSATRCRNAPDGDWFAVAEDQDVYVIEVGDYGLSEPRPLDHLRGPVARISCDPLGSWVAALYEDGQIRFQDIAGDSPPKLIHGQQGISELRISNDGSMLEAIKYVEDEAEAWVWSLADEGPTLLRQIDLGKASGSSGWTLNPVERQLVSVFNADAKIRLWPLRAPADAEPVLLGRGDVGVPRRVVVHPTGGWVASSFTNRLTLWPIARSYPTVIERYEERVVNLAFGPEGRWLVASSVNKSGTVRMWQLDGDNLPPAQIIHEAQTYAYGLAVTPDGKQILLGKFKGVDLLSLDGEPPRALPGAGLGQVVGGVVISPDGRFGAASTVIKGNTTGVISIWDLGSTEEVKVLEFGDGDMGRLIHFSEDRHLLSTGHSGLLRWDVETGDSEVLFEEPVNKGAVSSDGGRLLLFLTGIGSGLMPSGRGVVFDLNTGLTTPLTSHGDSITTIAMDAEGTIAVTGDEDGVIRVGPISGKEPHLLLGHMGMIYGLAVDPLGRWIASSGQDLTIRLWPMPDLSKPPLHTLPLEELIAKLKTLTNLRVVRDDESSTGWEKAFDPFPGWETVPTW